MFNVAGVTGQVSGAEIERHFLNGSPEPIEPRGLDSIKADDLPGRKSSETS